MINNETSGVIFFNRGEGCVVRALVCFYSLRKWYSGPATIYLEQPYPAEFEKACEYFNISIIRNDIISNLTTLVRKTEMFGDPPYDKTLWLDLDTVVVGSIDAMFEGLNNDDVCIPSFCDWISTGSTISKRIRQFNGIAENRHMEKALKPFPAINTGVLSFRKSEKWKKFVSDWVSLSSRGHFFISDEIGAQVLFPSIDEWGMTCKIEDKKFNVSVRYGNNVEDKRIIHMHGKKHVSDLPLCDVWKKEFNEMIEGNIGNIKSLLKYSDKRLRKYIKDMKIDNQKITINHEDSDVTIVTACDEYYVDILRETFSNWRKYKNIDKYPVMVFVHGIPTNDIRLDFLKLPNVTIVPWSMSNAESHREEMLSAFVFGTAENVKTNYWLKLDADSFAINDKPLFSENMKEFAFCGHKWSYSRPEHIKALDEWAKNHWKAKLKNAKPMINEGRIDGNRFFHNKRRTISYIQLHKTKFTRFCVSLLKEKKLPAPTQDTYMFFVCDRFDPQFIGTANFKKDHGFVQGRGKMGAAHIKEQLIKIDEENHFTEKTSILGIDECDMKYIIEKNEEPIISIKTLEFRDDLGGVDNIIEEKIKIPFMDSNGNRCIVEV